MIARTQSVWTLAQRVGLRSWAPAISGQEQMIRKPGRRLSSSVEIRAVGFLLSPRSLSITTSLRRKNEDIPLICRFGWEGRIKSRRVFGSGPIAVFSKTKNSQRGQRGRQAIMEAISIVWNSGWLGTMPIARRKTTLSAQSNCVLQVNFSSVMLRKNIAKGRTDPRVEFILQDHSSRFTNLEHITVSESQLSFNFKISTKHQHLD